MSISVLIESKSNGFVASTNSPISLIGEGSTEGEALSAIRTAFDERIRSGSRIIEIEISSADRLVQTAKQVGENPLFPEYLLAIEEYRQTANT